MLVLQRTVLKLISTMEKVPAMGTPKVKKAVIKMFHSALEIARLVRKCPSVPSQKMA